MSLRRYAQRLLREAEVRRESAEIFLPKRAFAYVVRQSQECVELALKAALRLVGIDHPKEHEVSAVLIEQRSAFPESFQRQLDAMVEISRVLYASRIPSMYGEEGLGKGPGDLFSEEEAREALEKADFVLRQAKKLVRGLRSE